MNTRMNTRAHGLVATYLFLLLSRYVKCPLDNSRSDADIWVILLRAKTHGCLDIGEPLRSLYRHSKLL